MNFIVIYEPRPFKEKTLNYITEIYSYDENILQLIQKKYRPDQYKMWDMIPGSFCIGDALEYFNDKGVRKTDYEMWLEGIKDAEPGCKFDENGNVLNKTDEEKKLDGELKLDEGTMIQNGKIVPIPYYDLKKLWGKPFSEFYSAISNEAQKIKSEKSINATVNLDGIIYQANQTAVDILTSLIAHGNEIKWRALNNQVYDLNNDQAESLCKAMNDCLQEIERSYWNIKDNIKAKYESGISFEEFIQYVESLVQSSLDKSSEKFARNYENIPTNEPIDPKPIEEHLATMTVEQAKTAYKKRKKKH